MPNTECTGSSLKTDERTTSAKRPYSIGVGQKLGSISDSIMERGQVMVFLPLILSLLKC